MDDDDLVRLLQNLQNEDGEKKSKFESVYTYLYFKKIKDHEGNRIKSI